MSNDIPTGEGDAGDYFADGPLYKATKENLPVNDLRERYTNEGWRFPSEVHEPAVQKIPGVSYQDGDRNNAPVSLHLDSLEQRIGMLHQRIASLKMAIDPILAPMGPGDPRTEAPTFECSPMLQRIKESDDILIGMIEYVERITAHVEV